MVQLFLEHITNLMIDQALGALPVKHLAFQVVDGQMLLLELLMDPWSLIIASS